MRTAKHLDLLAHRFIKTGMVVMAIEVAFSDAEGGRVVAKMTFLEMQALARAIRRSVVDRDFDVGALVGRKIYNLRPTGQVQAGGHVADGPSTVRFDGNYHSGVSAQYLFGDDLLRAMFSQGCALWDCAVYETDGSLWPLVAPAVPR